MTAETLKEIFWSQVNETPNLAAVARLAADAKKGGFTVDAELRIRVAAVLAHITFLAPDRTGQIFDAFAAGWLDKAVAAPPIATLDLPTGTVADELLNAYWSLVEDGVAGTLDAASITERTAGLGTLQNEVFEDRLARSAMQYPGVKAIAGRSTPPAIRLSTLAACPPGSIGRQYHDLIVDNGFNLEVLDAHALGLSKLQSPLDFLNARNLLTHDLWHIAAGYETTVLHEFAIAAFQLAQFGHNYSGNLMAVMTGITALGPATGFPILMDAVLTAWVHGRETSPMIGIPWEDSWDLSVEDIRQSYAISLYNSPHPANLLDRGAAAKA